MKKLLLLLLLLPRTSSKAAKLPNVPSESLETIVVVEKASAAAATAAAAAAAATNELQSLHLTFLKHTSFAPKHHLISPKRRPKCTAKVPNVPSESLERIYLFSENKRSSASATVAAATATTQVA